MATVHYAYEKLAVTVDSCQACANCGNDEDLDVEYDGVRTQVFCDKCGVHGPYATGEDRVFIAAKLWNKMNMHTNYLRKTVIETAQTLFSYMPLRPSEECPDLEAYADGHCNLVEVARSMLEHVKRSG